MVRKASSPCTSTKAQKITETNEEKPKSEEDNDPFLMPNISHTAKSRASSEKSINQKKLSMNKLSSDLSNTTQSSSVEKSKTPKDEEGVKDGKSFDLTNASLQNEQNLSLKEMDVPFPPTKETPDLPKVEPVPLPNKDFVENNFLLREEESVHSDEFMDEQLNEIHEVKPNPYPYEDEPIHKNFDFDMAQQVPMGEFGQHDLMDNSFDFEEPQDNVHGFGVHSFMNDELIGSEHRYD